MSRQWMYDDRLSPGFLNGMHDFLRVAEANKQNGFMCCPCLDCKNDRNYSNSKTLHVHLLEKGFMPHYNVWTKHGERGVIMEDNEEEEDDDNYPFADTTMGEAEEEASMGEAEEEASDEPADDLGRVIADAKRNCESDKERLKLKRMLEDHKKLLYPNCEDDQKKLGTTLKLLQWKAKNGVTDKEFQELLIMIKKMLPKDNELPESTYKAKKV